MVSTVISSLRLLAGPASLILIMNGDQTSLSSALYLMIAATLIGYLNTLLIRGETGQAETSRIFHTVSDSIYHISIFLAFLSMSWMSLWFVFLIYSRDIIVPYLQSFSLQRGLKIPDLNFGAKLKSVVHGLCQIGVVATALELIRIEGLSQDNVMLGLLALAAGASIISFINYLFLVLSTQPQTTEA